MSGCPHCRRRGGLSDNVVWLALALGPVLMVAVVAAAMAFAGVK